MITNSNKNNAHKNKTGDNSIHKNKVFIKPIEPVAVSLRFSKSVIMILGFLLGVPTFGISLLIAILLARYLDKKSLGVTGGDDDYEKACDDYEKEQAKKRLYRQNFIKNYYKIKRKKEEKEEERIKK
ncbi:MAG: hypothetical protein NTY74_16280 [Ignavibacteriae bacterium]|nr:hypothetical protein [Ignavibacteriota bacterium]